MKLSRTVTNRIRFLLDELIPPKLRDSRIIMTPAFRLLFKDKADLVLDFKSRAPFMDDTEIAHVYEQLAAYSSERETDLSPESIVLIEQNILGKTVLDVGCGRGFLVNKLAVNYEVTGVDIFLDKGIKTKIPLAHFKLGAIERLPFKNSSFDTVVCTHTLEHVKRLEPAIAELRRVTKKRLIIIVPKQRAYHYTFDLHLQFFPTVHSLLLAMQGNGSCEEIKGDLFFIEDMHKK